VSSAWWRQSLLVVLTVAATIVTIVGGMFLLDAHIDKRINEVITRPSYVAAIAARVRPALIFDATDRILTDLGAVSYVESLDVHMDDAGKPVEIHLVMREWLAQPPIVTSADEAIYTVEVTRGTGASWEYDLYLRMYSESQVNAEWKMTYPGDEDRPLRFRLEVIPNALSGLPRAN
jgi:hypothetical protein